VTEATSYDTAPAKRGYYSHTKILAEKLVRKFAAENNLAVTIFRPGLVFGKGRPLPSAPLAFRFGHKFMVVGSGRCLLALNYIENLVDALLLAWECKPSKNGDYNIIDDELLTSGEFHRLRGEIDGTTAAFVPSLPFRVAAPLVELLASRRGGKLASFSSHALSRVLRSTWYDTHLVREQLGWCPRVRLQDALKEILS
jgi:nucleoside-diphosphate-sugar epimerase